MIEILGSRGEVEEKTARISKHSGILIDDILIDIGEAEYLQRKPKLLLITHAHPDHFFPLRKKEELTIEIPTVLSSSSLKLAKPFLAGKLKTFPRRQVIRFKVGDLRITTFPVTHSIKAPTNGYILEIRGKKIVIPGDVLNVRRRIRDRLWTKADIYIGDGSFVLRRMVRRHKETGDIYGHASVVDQIKWCLKAGIPLAIFRHWGTEAIKKGLDWVREQLDKQFKDQPIRIILATDGTRIGVEEMEETIKVPEIKPIAPKRIIRVEPVAGLYLVPPHGKLIADRKKTLIVKTRAFLKYVDKPLYLISGKLAYGEIMLHEPREITREEFEKLRDKHMITKTEEKEWGWARRKNFYAYDFTVLRIYPEPKRVKIPVGPQVFITKEQIKFLSEIIERLKQSQLIVGWVEEIDPRKANDEQLRDDWRIILAWGSSILAGKKLFKRWKGEKRQITYRDVIDAGTKIAKEMIRRGFEFNRPETYRPRSRKVFKAIIRRLGGMKRIPWKGELEERFPPLRRIDPPFLQKLTDARLISLYKHLHALYRERGEVWEDLANAHVFVGTEMIKRGIYHDNKIDDELTTQTERFFLEYPTPRGLTKDRLYLSDVIKYFPDQWSLRIPPSQIYIAGRIVNEGYITRGHDIDLIVRGPYDRRMIDTLTRHLPVWLAKRLHWVFCDVGPIMGWAVPLYNKAWQKVEAVRKISPWEIYELSPELRIGRPVVGLKPRGGIGKFEFWDNQEMWRLWAANRIKRGIVVQRKFDGRRFQIHFDKDRNYIRIYTEDLRRDRSAALRPIADELLKYVKARNGILDAELEAYDLKGRRVRTANEKDRLGELIPREDTAAFTVGKVPADLLDAAVFQVYDLIYLNGKTIANQGYIERMRQLKKIIPPNLYYWRVVATPVANTKREFLRLVNKVRRMEDSEGAMLKVADSKYPLKFKGENRTADWAKMKNLKEIDVMVWQVHEKKTAEGRPLGVFMYDSVYQIPAEQKDRFWGAVEWKGKWYAPIGRSYGTKVRARKGDIITVMPIRIRRYEKQGKIVYTWMFPWFKEKKPEKKEPDTLTTVKRLERIGTAPLSRIHRLHRLAICPFYLNETICLFKNWFMIPRLSHLRFPIKCTFAYEYRCPYCKPYYYSKDEDTTDEIHAEDLDIGKVAEVNPKLANLALQELVARYMEYPPKNKPVPFVIQRHQIGKAQHFDFRIKANEHLVGWSVVGFSVDDPAEIRKFLDNPGKGFRAETKARQPLLWLKVEGEIEPGEIGAGREAAGLFKILAEGQGVHGAHKVWFHEYFLKGGPFKDWTRFIVRAVRVPRIDPVTKRPIKGKFELMWRWMYPKDQMPYALTARAIRVKWKPPKNIVPFPEDWAKKKFPKEYARWIDYMKKPRKTKASLEMEKWNFALVEHSWMGPVIVRAIPVTEWHLLLDDGKARVMDFKTESHPIYQEEVAFSYEGRIAKKWLKFEGKLRPMQHWNPNKELESTVRILSSGTVRVRREMVDKREIITLISRKEPFKGTKYLIQEEEKTPFYHFSPRRVGLAEQGFFVFEEHTVNEKKHWDLRYILPEFKGKFFEEFSSMRAFLPDLETEEPVLSIFKKGFELKWVERDFKEGRRKVGKLDTYVKRLDQGSFYLIERTPQFMSFMLRGKLLRGYFTAVRTPRGWLLMKGKVPTLEKRTGNPRKGDFFIPFKFIQKRNWDYFYLELYDIREFTRTLPEEEAKKYLPDLAIPAGVDVVIGLYSRVGKIHGARVVRVIFPETWTKERASAWIKENKLHTWAGEMIRK